MAKANQGNRKARRRGRQAKGGCETPLSRWLYRFRVSPKEMADRIGYTSNALSMWSNGYRRPNVDAIAAIARETLREEIELGIANPRGVPILDWFEEAAAPAVDVGDVKAAG